jgi:predicted alpha/beta-hydrolase family hydrolase
VQIATLAGPAKVTWDLPDDPAFLLVMTHGSNGGVDSVIALAFPLRPPWNPAKSRAGELRAAGVEVVVVNGDRDPFGVPDQTDATCVRVVEGERHDLARTPSVVGAVTAEWLSRWSGRG